MPAPAIDLRSTLSSTDEEGTEATEEDHNSAEFSARQRARPLGTGDGSSGRDGSAAWAAASGRSQTTPTASPCRYPRPAGWPNGQPFSWTHIQPQERPHNASGNLPGRPFYSDLVLNLDPYQVWVPRRLPDANTASDAAVVEAVVEIVTAEGPVLAARVYELYVRASGGYRVGKNVRQALIALPTPRSETVDSPR